MRVLATAAEPVKFAIQRIPLDLYHPPKKKEDAEKSLNTICIYEDVEVYDKSAGIENSVDFYFSGTGSVFLQQDKFITDQKPNYQFLVHDLTHLNSKRLKIGLGS